MNKKRLSALSPVVAVCGCNSLLASNNLWLKSPLTFLCCCVFALLRLKNGLVFPPQPEKKKKQPSQRIYYILFWCVHFLKKITKNQKKKKPSVVIYPVCSSSPSLRVSLGVLCDCLWVHIYTEIGRGVVTAWERGARLCNETHNYRVRDGYCSCDWQVPFSHKCSFLSEACFSVFYFFLPEGHGTFCCRARSTKASLSPGWGVCSEIMHDLHSILGYDRLPYSTEQLRA